MTTDKKPRFFYGYVVVLAFFCISAIAGGLWTVFGVFFNPLLIEFGWTRAMLSGVVSLRAFLMAIFGIGAGRLTDKFGPRPVITVCGLFLGLGFFLMSQVTTIWQLYLVYGVITGIGMCSLWVPVLSTVSRWFVKRRVLMTGIVLSGMGLGSMMTPPLATQLIITYGWRPSWTILGVTAVIIIILAAQFVRREPAQVGQLPDGKNEVEAESLDLQAGGLSLGEVVRTMHFWILCAVFSCLWFSSMAIWVHLVVHAIDLGISAINASSILAVMGGVGIVSRILMGSVADRVGYKPTLLIGFALVSASLLWLLTAKELWALYLFAVIFGFGISGLIVLESPLIARLFGLASLSVIFGSIEFVSTIFGAASPIVAGLIFDITGSYQLAFLIGAATGIIGLILTLLLKPITNYNSD